MSKCNLYGHLPVITFSNRLRDWFWTRYWLRCWDCDHVQGPFKTDAEARQAMKELRCAE